MHRVLGPGLFLFGVAGCEEIHAQAFPRRSRAPPPNNRSCCDQGEGDQNQPDDAVSYQ